ncbi:MAG: penicillin-binding protein [Sphingobacteriales bacterium 50-39]|nr:PASTA domain-containing protein [Sphingobacteriales bacterium]OJW60624.1 MAG: penicillin-binding protein [Sphingobacteriales bacterium 50-39]
MFKFLTTKPLWINILAGIGLLLFLLLIFLGSLALLTQHGKTMKIPSVTGLSYTDAKKTLESEGFGVQIQDSVYSDTMAPLKVVKQFPEADNLVKVNRTVYLTINRSEAPFIQMPNLVSMSFRNAEMILRQYGLRLEDTVFKPDFAKNSVLDQLYKGETIKPGSQIRQGSAITLVLGSGIGGIGYIVPDLFGLTYQQAKSRLDSMSLIFGAVTSGPDVRDTADGYIYKQTPDQFGEDGRPNRIHPGQTIDIWLGAQRPIRRTDTATTNGGAY